MMDWWTIVVSVVVKQLIFTMVCSDDYGFGSGCLGSSDSRFVAS